RRDHSAGILSRRTDRLCSRLGVVVGGRGRQLQFQNEGRTCYRSALKLLTLENNLSLLLFLSGFLGRLLGCFLLRRRFLGFLGRRLFHRCFLRSGLLGRGLGRRLGGGLLRSLFFVRFFGDGQFFLFDFDQIA